MNCLCYFSYSLTTLLCVSNENFKSKNHIEQTTTIKWVFFFLMRHYLETKLAEVELAVATVRKLNAHISAQCQNQRTKLPRIRGPREKSEKEQTTTYWSCCFYLVLLNVLMFAYVCVCLRMCTNTWPETTAENSEKEQTAI